jgi:hypothetical protein
VVRARACAILGWSERFCNGGEELTFLGLRVLAVGSYRSREKETTTI